MIRLKDQSHPATFQLRVSFHLTKQLQLFFDALEQFATKVHVGHLTTSKLQCELDLVAFPQELPRVIDLDLQIVIADLHRPKFQLLQLPRSRAGAAAVFFLLLLVAPFAVIHDAAHRRPGSRGDLDQVHSGFPGHAQRICRRDDAYLFFFFVDEPNG